MPACSTDPLTANIKRLADEAGFDYCGISRPKVSERDSSALQQWVEAGMHADMAWMAEPLRLARRQAPQTMLAGIRSVISVGLRYTPPLPAPAADATPGIISAYAAGDDYHIVMKKRLKQLARALDQRLGQHDQRLFVDTAPVLEHALAAAGGIGWQGKHTLTLNRHGGSWMLLGELFTTAKLVPDAPATNHCGSCNACITSCPTNAIVAPFVVDARRCISWLTIEYDGVIPLHLRPAMGGRIYGCDDCQMVCPWSGKAEHLSHDLLQPRPENIAPPLTEILQLDETRFHQRFRKSPIKRSGRTRLLRNACVAAGNSGDKATISPLLELLTDPQPLIRSHAIWALRCLIPHDLVGSIPPALIQLYHKESDPAVLEALAEII
ncbi:MAG: tRNA epoxyqueuosine(34) reductase QueG [Mariprofundales bacterium]